MVVLVLRVFLFSGIETMTWFRFRFIAESENRDDNVIFYDDIIIVILSMHGLVLRLNELIYFLYAALVLSFFTFYSIFFDFLNFCNFNNISCNARVRSFSTTTNRNTIFVF